MSRTRGRGAAAASPLRRAWIYQAERFPLAAHGPLIAAFSLGAIGYSAQLRGASAWPSAGAAAVAFGSSLLFFLQLRVADEFKDAEEDARWRPYRPVPRGLVALRELGWAGVLAAAGQLVLALWLSPALVPLLGAAWVYLALMSREFFVRDWIVARPVTYLWTHMLIMPIVDFYVTACDWRPGGGGPPPGLGWFIAASFFNGIVLELGRKIRAPADEERGVRTYTVLWGRAAAVAGWGTALAASAGCALAAGARIGAAATVGWTAAGLGAAAVVVAWRFLRRPIAGSGRALEAVSGLWMLGLYVAVGIVPFVSRWWRSLP